MDKQEGPGLLGELGTAEGFSAGSPRPGPQPGHLRSPSAFVGCVLWSSEQRPPPCPGQPQPLPSLTLSHLRSDLPVGLTSPSAARRRTVSVQPLCDRPGRVPLTWWLLPEDPLSQTAVKPTCRGVHI